jgi:hypothetical protein
MIGTLLDFLCSDFSFSMQEKAEIRVFCEAITANPEQIVGPVFQHMVGLGPRLRFGLDRVAVQDCAVNFIQQLSSLLDRPSHLVHFARRTGVQLADIGLVESEYALFEDAVFNALETLSRSSQTLCSTNVFKRCLALASREMKDAAYAWRGFPPASYPVG